MKGQPHPIACPRCGATVAADASWCLNCGTPARTRIRPTPGLRLPILLAALLAIVAVGAGLGGLLALTSDSGTLTTTVTVPNATTPGQVTPAPGVGVEQEPQNGVPTTPTTPPAGANMATTATTPSGSAANTPGSSTATVGSGSSTQPAPSSNPTGGVSALEDQGR